MWFNHEPISRFSPEEAVGENGERQAEQTQSGSDVAQQTENPLVQTADGLGHGVEQD